MALRTFAPPPSLAAFVDAFWVEDGEDHEAGVRPLVQQRVLPDGKPLLALNLSKGESLRIYHPGVSRCGESFPGAFLRGPHSDRGASKAHRPRIPLMVGSLLRARETAPGAVVTGARPRDADQKQ